MQNESIRSQGAMADRVKPYISQWKSDFDGLKTKMVNSVNAI